MAIKVPSFFTRAYGSVFVVALVLGILLAACETSWGDGEGEGVGVGVGVGHIGFLQGKVLVKSKSTGQTSPAVVGQEISTGDKVLAEDGGRVKVDNIENFEMDIFPHSEMEFSSFHDSNSTRSMDVALNAGRARIILIQKFDDGSGRGGFQVKTPAGTATAEGADILVTDEANSNKMSAMKVVTFDGSVRVGSSKTAADGISVNRGQSSELMEGGSPASPTLVDPADLAHLDNETRLGTGPVLINPPKAARTHWYSP